MQDIIIDLYTLNNSKYFEENSDLIIKQRLKGLPDDAMIGLDNLTLRDPLMMFFISLLAGSLGIDRFILGDILIGVIKLALSLLSIYIAVIVKIIDLTLIMKRTKLRNYEKVINYINYIENTSGKFND